jgi:hypothetical protein
VVWRRRTIGASGDSWHGYPGSAALLRATFPCCYLSSLLGARSKRPGFNLRRLDTGSLPGALIAKRKRPVPCGNRA